MVVQSMSMSWRDSVRRGHYRLMVWTQRNGASMCSRTQVSNGGLTSCVFSVEPDWWVDQYFDSITRQTLITLLFMLLCKVHLPTLLSTRPSWSPMAGSWDWTPLTEVTWHTASWLTRRKSQQRPSSLSPCRTRYKTFIHLSTHNALIVELDCMNWEYVQLKLEYKYITLFLYYPVAVSFTKSFLSMLKIGI